MYGNSARSLLAEALLRSKGGDAFEVHSAGTHPKGVNPLTLQVLHDAGLDASWARSKSVDEYLGQSFDYVITVCDEAATSARSSPASTNPSTGATTTRRGRGHRGGAPGRVSEGVHPDGERIGTFIPLARKHRAAAGSTTIG